MIGFQGILRYKIEDKGASLAGTELEPILSSRDPNFRPSDIEVGPDGAIYFLDWQNPIIGHMQHNLRDPSRDRIHGRVYRVTYQGRPLSQPARIAGTSIEELLELLKSPEDRVRYRARTELGARDTAQVVAALKTWVDKLDKSSPDHEHHLTEALWAHQYQDVVNVELLEPRARINRFSRPGRRGAGALRLARPGSGCARHVPEAGRRSLSARAARSDPGRQLLPGRRGRRGAADRGRSPD